LSAYLKDYEDELDVLFEEQPLKCLNKVTDIDDLIDELKLVSMK